MVGAGLGEDVDAVLGIEIPLFQINFLPDLIQVNFLLPTTEVAPALLQAAPALVTAPELGRTLVSKNNAIEVAAMALFIKQGYWKAVNF